MENSVCQKLKPVYVISEELLLQSSKIPHLENRALMVHCLVKSYNLLNSMHLVKSIPAKEDELCSFHSKLYINHLKSISENNSTFDNVNNESNIEVDVNSCGEEFGIGYDCPLIDDVYKFVSVIAGGTITAARCLTKKLSNVAINWCGGWHHAQRDEAEGFCYINDIVVGIEELIGTFGRVLYIDLDIHHGNGVENAYKFSRKVFTLSIHKFESGFYPGTGSLEDVGSGTGKYYCANVPLYEGISDTDYFNVFSSISKEILATFKPNVTVVQCGADCLTGDKLGGFNLTQIGIGQCIKEILTWDKPTLFLGGGGYNIPNVARCWTYLTSIIANCPVNSDIPENPYFTEFGPDFTLRISPSNMKSSNSEEYLLHVVRTIINNVHSIKDEQYTYLSMK